MTSLVVKNALTREGLKRILIDNGFGVAQATASLDELDVDQVNGAHIVLYDGAVRGSDCDLDPLASLMTAAPECRVVLLVESFDFDRMNRAFAAGVYGYIPQNIPYQSFLVMIQLVALGEKVAPSELIDSLSDRQAMPVERQTTDVAALYGLVERDREILECLVMGMPNKIISRRLGVSEATVKLHVKTIFRKMSVNNRTQAAMMARFPMLPFESDAGANGEALR
ncbi:LuxR C-terminal-related transcriptional regulator [Sphingomonas sp. AX6]|uniref:LuxR C-terminal-related transcriptional regulator n=1 Tax=Sphingomonas sp. AX6 TaxID=2653171 RepID=UPI0013568307|nr:response regulator transcription factor [Sphingomonas sp. AX6]